MKYSKYLPIGTVVLLKEGTHKLLIVGFTSAQQDRKVYDYIGVLFPEGVLSFDKSYLFNHEDIVEVSHLGLSNKDSRNFNEKIKFFVDNYVDANGYLIDTPENLAKQFEMEG